MSQPYSSVQHSSAPEGLYATPFGNGDHQHPLIDFNARMQRDAFATLLNEKYLEKLLSEFQAIPRFSPAVHGLTLTRLNELALICAGNYADSCEFSAAGDLMVNPPEVMVHVRGKVHPVLKDRHNKLTAQFKDAAACGTSLINWFIKNTIVEVRKKPILMRLNDMMKASGVVSDFYIASADRRMKQIADTMGFLSAWRVESAEGFHQKLKTASPTETAFINKALCRLDRRLFDEMKADICGFLWDENYQSRFIDL